MTETRQNPWDRLRKLAAAGDAMGLSAYLQSLEPDDVVRAILRLDPDDQDQVLLLLEPAEAAHIIEDLPDEQAAELIEHLSPSAAAVIVSAMHSDERADLVADLDRKDADILLGFLSPDIATELRALARYPDDVAGGLMETEIIVVEEGETVRSLFQQVVEQTDRLSGAFTRYVYVVSSWRRLVGVAALSELAVASRDAPIADLATPPLHLRADTGLDELKDFFEAHPFAGAPVVDGRGVLLGVVRRTRVLDALAERAEREQLRMRGIVGGEEIRSLPTLTRSRRRLSWLSINIVLNLVAASVIALFIDTLDAVIALAVFLPIISDMSGASGNQAVAVSMRELSIGAARPSDVVHVWLKEVSVGILNGLALGVLLGVVALVWQGNGTLGVVVGVALAVNTVIAVSIGGTVPLALKRLGVDPALASGPILTTVTDICGFFLVLGLATILLAQLT